MSTTEPTRRGRPATGRVIEKPTRRGTTFALRFTAYGDRRYITLGTTTDGWTSDRAERELRYVLAQAERGVWEPPAPTGPANEDPTFHVFASAWFQGIRSQLRPNTIAAYEWELTHHLLPFFRDHRLTEITVGEVDRYREAKVAEAEQRQAEITRRDAERQAALDAGRPAPRYAARVRPLSADSINKTITRLGQVLELAVEREVIVRNPVRVNPRRRKLPRPRPTRTFIERPVDVELLLASTTPERGGDVERRAVRARALLGVLVLAGLRVGEAIALRWGDVNLATGQLRVRAAKTAAGERTVDVVPRLRELLADHKAAFTDAAPGALVFATAAGGMLDRGHVNGRLLGAAVRRTNAQLDDAGEAALPPLSPHSLRRTFISQLLHAGHPVPYVMAQVGHTDPSVTLGVYAQVLACREAGAAEAVARLVGDGEHVQTPARAGAQTS